MTESPPSTTESVRSDVNVTQRSLFASPRMTQSFLFGVGSTESVWAYLNVAESVRIDVIMTASLNVADT
jgi:hypothetical protein